jgi:hypothetical protein
MQRVRYYEYGGPEVLTVEAVDPPTPQTGQVLLRTEAIGVNFVDTRFRRGPGSGSIFQRPLPGRPTGDVVGVVEQVGPDVDPHLMGTRVAALAEDAYADYVVADAAWLAAVPDALEPGDASTLAMSGPVALRVLRAARPDAGVSSAHCSATARSRDTPPDCTCRCDPDEHRLSGPRHRRPRHRQDRRENHRTVAVPLDQIGASFGGPAMGVFAASRTATGGFRSLACLPAAIQPGLSRIPRLLPRGVSAVPFGSRHGHLGRRRSQDVRRG